MRAYQRENAARLADPSNVAQQFGYPPKTLEALIKLGIRIRAGSYINEPDVELLCAAHPEVPADVILERVRAVNMTPKDQRFNAYVAEVTASNGSDGAYQNAVKLVNDYEFQDHSVQLENKLGAGDAKRGPQVRNPDGTLVPVTKKVPKHIVTSDGQDIRKSIEAAMQPKVMPTREDVLNAAADAIEAQTNRIEVNTKVSGLPDDRRGDIAAAFNAERAVDSMREMGELPEEEDA